MDYVTPIKHNIIKVAEFGNILTLWKTESGWSDQRIIDATGLDRTTVAAIRRNKSIPQWRTRKLLWDKLPGFRKLCQQEAPHLLERYPT